VHEALEAGVPATELRFAAPGGDRRMRDLRTLAGDRGVPAVEVRAGDLDRLGRAHQGVALAVPPYRYAHPDDLLSRADGAGEAALIVALDQVTDPRNLGAIVRSAAAFGAHGVVVPERRSAGLTAAAWKASAGAAARISVAQATNLVRTLRSYAEAGLLVVGLDAAGELDLEDFAAAVDPFVLVVGSEGRGIARLTREACDLVVRIPMAAGAESLNASVAAGIALAATHAHRQAAERDGGPRTQL
jgi:23S rRNA (guanosine2251-2'-O)-methyltransferase